MESKSKKIVPASRTHRWPNPPTLSNVLTNLTLRTPWLTYLPPQGVATLEQFNLGQPLLAFRVVSTLDKVRKATRSRNPSHWWTLRIKKLDDEMGKPAQGTKKLHRVLDLEGVGLARIAHG